jgi:cysteinyl-tRNA synthetase
MAVLSDDQAEILIRTLDEIDTQIEDLQAAKRDALADAREGMKGERKETIAQHIDAVKAATKRMRKLRMKPEAAEADDARDELAEHYVALVCAPRATHVRAA